MSEYIKKEDAIKTVYQIVEQLAHSSLEWDELKLWAKEQIEKIPSAEPEQENGEWVISHTTCSRCGWQMMDDVIQSPNMVFFNYCPNCGAKMEEKGE